MIDDLQRHRPVGQQLQRPPRATFGLGTAGDGDQPRLLFPVEHPQDARTHLFPALQRRVQPLFHQPLAEVLDRPNADAKCPGGVRVLHLWTRFRLVHRQQDVGMADTIRRRLARVDQLFQTVPLPGLQPNDILFHADPP
jgi:hypothetical protein